MTAKLALNGLKYFFTKFDSLWLSIIQLRIVIKVEGYRLLTMKTFQSLILFLK